MRLQVVVQEPFALVFGHQEAPVGRPFLGGFDDLAAIAPGVLPPHPIPAEGIARADGAVLPIGIPAIGRVRVALAWFPLHRDRLSGEPLASEYDLFEIRLEARDTNSPTSNVEEDFLERQKLGSPGLEGEAPCPCKLNPLGIGLFGFDLHAFTAPKA